MSGFALFSGSRRAAVPLTESITRGRDGPAQSTKASRAAKWSFHYVHYRPDAISDVMEIVQLGWHNWDREALVQHTMA